LQLTTQTPLLLLTMLDSWVAAAATAVAVVVVTVAVAVVVVLVGDATQA